MRGSGTRSSPRRGGNPLALLELPRGLTAAELAGGFGLPGAVPLAGRIEDSFRRRLDALPAADPAAAAAGGGRSVRGPGAGVAGGRAAGDRCRGGAAGGGGGPGRSSAAGCGSGIRWSARRPTGRRRSRTGRQAHAALAEATDPAADPDRRAWHRAAGRGRPDEDVAAELERSAGRAQARGGLAAAAAFLERAAVLTADPARRAGRTLAAAQASLQAGAFGKALDLLATAEAGPLDELQGARADLLRGQIAFASGLGSDAPPLLLKAARRLEPLDLDLARETYLDAWHAAVFAGHLAAPAICLRSPAPPGPCPRRRIHRAWSTCCWTAWRC